MKPHSIWALFFEGCEILWFMSCMPVLADVDSESRVRSVHKISRMCESQSLIYVRIDLNQHKSSFIKFEALLPLIYPWSRNLAPRIYAGLKCVVLTRRCYVQSNTNWRWRWEHICRMHQRQERMGTSAQPNSEEGDSIRRAMSVPFEERSRIRGMQSERRDQSQVSTLLLRQCLLCNVCNKI